MTAQLIGELDFLGLNITFYETEDDRDNQVNALDPLVPYEPTSFPQTLYITIESATCLEVEEIELDIIPIVEFESAGLLNVCDEDQDGLTTTNLSQFDSAVTEGQTGFTVTYFATQNDADNNQNPLPNNYTNTTNPFTLYPRIQAASTGCASVNSFDVEVLPAPVTLEPLDLVICDDDQDAFSLIDLNAKISEVVENTTDRIITFHNTQGDADNGQNPIDTSSLYNADTQAIFVRVENTVTGCHSTESFQVTVNTLPVFTAISNYKICEDSSDGFGDFVFETKDAEILNGQTGKVTSYYLTQADADNRMNEIDKTVAYQNTSNPQTIYVRVENITDQDCYGTSSFIIEVGSNPVFNVPADWFVCDDISNDGFETFDLSTKITEISQGITDNLDITFYTTMANAENGANPLPLQFTNTVNPQTIFVQIDNGTICNSITSFELNVVQSPDANPASDITLCDDDYDGLVTLDLTVSELEILDVRQDNIVITYFGTIEDLEANTNAIIDPTNYTTISNPQTIYVQLTNTISNCSVSVPFDVIVNLPPVINDFSVYEICDNDNSAFDLSIINTEIVDDTTGLNISYYSTLSDAEAGQNAIATNYTYTTSNDTIYVRIVNTATGCYTTYDFNLQINPLPIANTPPTVLLCDDVSNDGVEAADLETQNNSILGSQSASNFTISYHTSQLHAEQGINTLPNPYNASQGETIYARIINNTTGCHNTTQFQVEIKPHAQATFLAMCDTDTDGITSFDLTLSEEELYPSLPANATFIYYESESDLIADINAIADPTDYTNTSNPQEVYVKTYYTDADCYNYVPIELMVNLPPEIVDFGVHSICENATNSFDLSEINSVIVEDQYNTIITYYTNSIDAGNAENPLNPNYTYITNNDYLFARVEFTTTRCHVVYGFNLQVNPLPEAIQPNDLEACDDDFDGIQEFNLSSQTNTILGGQDSNAFSVSYFNTLEDLEIDTNELPSDYMAFDGEEIFARVENLATGCYNTTQFNCIVHPLPEVNIGNQVVCLDNLPLVVSADTNQAGDTYLWSTGETTSEIEITEIGTYWVTVISEFDCEFTEVFQVSESEAATIEVTETIDFSDPNNITVTISGIGNYLYQLNDGEPQASNVFENVPIGYNTLTIIDLNGCANVTKEVVVIDAPKFFTPNDDGAYDTWHIAGVETLPGTTIHIFDRYGKQLAFLTSTSQGWDGRYNGYEMPSTDYWFLANVQKDGIQFQVKGHFALRR